MEYKEGDEIRCTAPFVKYDPFPDPDGAIHWNHEIRFESDGEYSTIGIADGEGVAVFKIIRIVDMPSPFADRILYMKKVIDPDGQEGKFGNLLMLGERAFKRLSTGGKWNYDII